MLTLAEAARSAASLCGIRPGAPTRVTKPRPHRQFHPRYRSHHRPIRQQTSPRNHRHPLNSCIFPVPDFSPAVFSLLLRKVIVYFKRPPSSSASLVPVNASRLSLHLSVSLGTLCVLCRSSSLSRC